MRSLALRRSLEPSGTCSRRDPRSATDLRVHLHLDIAAPTESGILDLQDSSSPAASSCWLIGSVRGNTLET